MSGTLIFDTTTVRKLVDHAKAATEHRATYGHKAEPALILVGDQGVYLMSSGIPHLPLPGGKPDSSLVAYAKGTDPKAGGDDWYEEKRALYGGDDGADALPLAGIEDALAACEAARVAFEVRLSPSSISVLAPAPPKRTLRCDWRKECQNPVTHIGEKGYVYCATDAPNRSGTERVRKLLVSERKALERGERLPSWAKPAGLTVTLDEHEPPVAVASLREAALRCSGYRDEHNLGSRDWSGGAVKLAGKLVATVSYNGRVWTPKGEPIEGDALDKLPAKAPVRKRATRKAKA